MRFVDGNSTSDGISEAAEDAIKANTYSWYKWKRIPKRAAIKVSLLRRILHVDNVEEL